MDQILQDIIEKRMLTIKQKGLTFGHTVPQERLVPVNLPDFKTGAVICEIKRGSPSEGRMQQIPDPISWAADYLKAGADVISILTEEHFFFGSLDDLMQIKSSFPHASVLRKDFLFDPAELEVSYRAGADLVLLITSVLTGLDPMHSTNLLKSMMDKALNLGMMPLIEVHDLAELELILPLNPPLIGINSRNLKTFKINRGYPYGLKELIPPSTFVVYESGIRNQADAFFPGSAGFNAVLVGSSIVKSGNVTDKIKEIRSGFFSGRANPSDFYRRLFYKIYIEQKTVVKVCGITNLEDAEVAVNQGADLIGFIFAPSKRRISHQAAEKICRVIGNRALKVGVVVNEGFAETAAAVREGWLDAVQFHGEIENEKAAGYAVNWYKVIRVAKESDLTQEFYCPITLFDAFSKEAYGGTGKQIDAILLTKAQEKGMELYLAGGITPENVTEIIRQYTPLLIDLSTGLEEYPGKKDPEKIKKFFKVIKESSKCLE